MTLCAARPVPAHSDYRCLQSSKSLPHATLFQGGAPVVCCICKGTCTTTRPPYELSPSSTKHIASWREGRCPGAPTLGREIDPLQPEVCPYHGRSITRNCCVLQDAGAAQSPRARARREGIVEALLHPARWGAMRRGKPARAVEHSAQCASGNANRHGTTSLFLLICRFEPAVTGDNIAKY
jgi:hypothetical protein